MSIIETESKTPLQVLETCRAIFASSHWIVGSYTSIGWDDKTRVEKAMACSVGGLRYAMLAPLEHALDETWMYANMDTLGREAIITTSDDEGSAEVYLQAILALARVVANDHTMFETYYREHMEEYVGMHGQDSIWERLSWVEDQIVQWNDGFEYGDNDEVRRNLVAEYILPKFDEAIDGLKLAAAQVPMEGV